MMDVTSCPDFLVFAFTTQFFFAFIHGGYPYLRNLRQISHNGFNRQRKILCSLDHSQWSRDLGGESASLTQHALHMNPTLASEWVTQAADLLPFIMWSFFLQQFSTLGDPSREFTTKTPALCFIWQWWTSHRVQLSMFFHSQLNFVHWYMVGTPT